MGHGGFWVGLEYPPYPTIPASHIPGSQGGKGRVQTPLRALGGLNHLLITEPSSLVLHPPAQLLPGTMGIFTSPALSQPPVLLHCSRCLCSARSHVVATNSPQNHHGVTRTGQRAPVSVQHHSITQSREQERAKGMTPKVPSPRYFSRKFPWDLPLAEQKRPLPPSFHCSCWGWRSAGAKELLWEEEADPGHLDKSLQGSRPACLLPRDKREAALLRGTDTGLISSGAGAVTVSREAKMGERRREGGRRWGCQHPKMFPGNQPQAAAGGRSSASCLFYTGSWKAFFCLEVEN